MIRVFLDRLYLFSGYLAGLFLIAIFVLMMLLSGGRPLGINIPAGDDFISWCMAATAFLGLAHTFKHGEMIRVGLLIDRLNDNVRHYVEIAALLVGVGFIGFFAWHASRHDLAVMEIFRHFTGRHRGAAVDSAARLQRRARDSVHRVCR